jgi:hypothetical protein
MTKSINNLKNIKFNKNLLKLSFKVVSALFSLLLNLSKKDLKLIRNYFYLLNKDINNHGIIHTVKLYKQTRLHITRYLCGDPLRRNQLGIGIDKEG